MSFVQYRIVLKPLAPLYVGKRKYGNLMETREYVPGRTLWGALTARITRDYFGGNPHQYDSVGEFFNENFRFGYLWPSLDGEKPYFPWKHDDFDYLFKFGYVGQPIDCETKSTEEGNLHEVEFIGSRTREGGHVYLIGNLWIREDKLLENGQVLVEADSKSKQISLEDVFNTIQLGGEKGYGWGRVKIEKFEKDKSDFSIYNAKVDTSKDEVILEFKKDSYLPFHALATGELEGKVSGPIEPFIGYEFRGAWSLSLPYICYVPGCKILDNFESLKLKIDTYGILHLIKNC